MLFFYYSFLFLLLLFLPFSPHLSVTSNSPIFKTSCNYETTLNPIFYFHFYFHFPSHGLFITSQPTYQVLFTPMITTEKPSILPMLVAKIHLYFTLFLLFQCCKLFYDYFNFFASLSPFSFLCIKTFMCIGQNIPVFIIIFILFWFEDTTEFIFIYPSMNIVIIKKIYFVSIFSISFHFSFIFISWFIKSISISPLFNIL